MNLFEQFPMVAAVSTTQIVIWVIFVVLLVAYLAKRRSRKTKAPGQIKY